MGNESISSSGDVYDAGGSPASDRGVVVRAINVLPIIELTCTPDRPLKNAGITWEPPERHKRKNPPNGRF
jgi:hypothetical protein